MPETKVRQRPEDRITGKNGGRVPLAFWQKSFLIDVRPDDDGEAPPWFSRGPNANWYVHTDHPEYTRWLVGFVKGAANAVDAAIKRQKN